MHEPFPIEVPKLVQQKKNKKKRLKTRCQDLVSVLNAAPYEVAVEISETVWVGGPEIEKTWC